MSYWEMVTELLDRLWKPNSTAGLNSQAVALADVDGDGKLDLAVVDNCIPPTDTCGGEFVDVFLSGMEMALPKAAKSSALSSADVTFIGLTDLNGDGKPERGDGRP